MGIKHDESPHGHHGDTTGIRSLTAIEAAGLAKSYGSVTAVDGIDLTVERGEAFGFLGANGAGKSTTIDLLLGFQRPSDGRATVLGHDATAESRAVRERVGLLPEGFNTHENLTGREHVASAIQTKNADDDPDALIERVGLDPDDARRATGGYSKGMAQRLGLAIALVGDPDLLILDEPSSGLDPNGVKRLREIVREEVERGATVFFSSHVLDQVEKVCDRIGIMHDGALVAVDTIEDLRTEAGTSIVVKAHVTATPDVATVRAVEGVRDATVTNETVRATCSRPDAKMRVLAHLDDHATVRDIHIEERSLESLFEAYTGVGEAESTPDDAPPEEPTIAATTGGANR